MPMSDSPTATPSEADVAAAAEWAAALAEAEREIAELEAVEQATGTTAPNPTATNGPPAAGQPLARRRLVRPWLLATLCLGGGLTGGVIVQFASLPPDAAHQDSHAPETSWVGEDEYGHKL